MKNYFKNIRSTFIWSVLLLFSFNLLAQGSAPGYLYVYPSDPSAYPDQQGGVSNPTLQDFFSVYQVVSYHKSFPGAVSQMLQNAYEIHCDGDVDELKAKFESTGLFSLVELDVYMQTAGMPILDCPEPCSNPQSVNDPNSSYELTLPGYPCAWNITQGDPSVVVAVVDTDFDLNHPDLQGQIISKVGTPGSSGCSYHGLVVAACIVAIPNNNTGVAGVAPGAKVAGYVVNSSGSCTNGCSGDPWPSAWQAYLDGRRIINMSWCCNFGSGTVVEAIKEMTENGTLLVLAAGNGDPGDISHANYSNIPGVMNISSISSDGTLHQWVHYNQYVDLCAPGNGVGTLTFDCGSSTLNNAWGTSQSAPNVAGAAALILSVNPCLKPSEIENILKTTTCPIINNQYPNWTGTGYLNAYAAVLKAQGYSGSISVSDTWTGENYVSADVVVENNVTLTINGTVKFSEGASLIIKPGGRVNLYGTLTNSCMGPWDGVVVEGIATESQYTAGKHGRLYTYDGAVIENAVTGVKLIGGGVLRGKGTTIKNDGTGVAYSPYSNFWPFPFPAGQQGQPRNHFGSLSNCNFLWNNDFNKALPIGSGVDMLEVRGVNIVGCSFINDRTIKNPASNASYGYGVKATDARFTVASLGIGNTYPPSSYDHTAFQGLGYGVYVGTAQSGINGTIHTSDDFVNVPYTVQQATFSQCIYGIHNRFVSQGTIVGNTFNMGKLPPASPLSGGAPYTNEQFGVFIENGANGFELQENLFIKVPNNVQFANGTYCQNLGWFNNDVRRNTYTNVNYGNLADEDNAITAPNRGLYYLCNTNTTQRHDFYVFPGSDIRLSQGLEISTPTGITFNSASNTFTKANPPDGDFANNGPQVRYYHHGFPERPVFFSGLVFSDVLENNCASDYCLPPCRENGELPALKAEYATEKGLYQTAVSEMQGALATGNPSLADQKSNTAAAHRLKLDQLSNLLSLHLAFDTITYSLDSVRVWWQKMDSPVSEMVVARDYLAKGQTVTAFAILDGIPSKYGLSENGLADLAAYRDIMQIMQGESAGSLPQNKTAQLLNYANNGAGYSAAWAKNILTVKGYHFPPKPKHPAGSEERNSAQKNKLTVLKSPYVISPNPANDYVYFTCTNLLRSANPIIVTDATGRVIWQSLANQESPTTVWGTTTVRSGVYFYSIYDASGLIQSGRIAIVK